MDWPCNVLPSLSWLCSDNEGGFRGVPLRRRPNVFLILPPELRLMVYRLLFSPPEGLIHVPFSRDRHGHLCFNRAQVLHPAILQTCKLIHGEAVRILYSNMIVIDIFEATIPMSQDYLGEWCRKIGERNASNIKKLRFLGHGDDLQGYRAESMDLLPAIRARSIGRAIKLTLQYLKSLQVLEVQPDSWDSQLFILGGWPFTQSYPSLRMDVLDLCRAGIWVPPFVELLEESDRVRDIVVVPSYGVEDLDEDERVLQQYLNDLLVEKKRSRELKEAKKKMSAKTRIEDL